MNVLLDSGIFKKKSGQVYTRITKENPENSL